MNGASRHSCLFQTLNCVVSDRSLSSDGSLPASILTIFFYIVLQAFICGTYESVRIRRNKKGQAEITTTWRIGFVAQPPKKVNWRDREGVGFGHYDATSLFDWVMVVVFLPFGIIGAILWWYYVIRADRFFAALTRDHEYPETYFIAAWTKLRRKRSRKLRPILPACPSSPSSSSLSSLDFGVAALVRVRVSEVSRLHLPKSEN